MNAPASLDRFRVDGQVAVVTGGAHGIGLACVQLLATAGARVVVDGAGFLNEGDRVTVSQAAPQAPARPAVQPAAK